MQNRHHTSDQSHMVTFTFCTYCMFYISCINRFNSWSCDAKSIAVTVKEADLEIKLSTFPVTQAPSV